MFNPGRNLFAMFSRFAATLENNRTRGDAIRDLRRMSGLELADIGITRSQIPEIVDGLMAQNSTGTEIDRGRQISRPAAKVRPISPAAMVLTSPV